MFLESLCQLLKLVLAVLQRRLHLLDELLLRGLAELSVHLQHILDVFLLQQSHKHIFHVCVAEAK